MSKTSIPTKCATALHAAAGPAPPSLTPYSHRSRLTYMRQASAWEALITCAACILCSHAVSGRGDGRDERNPERVYPEFEFFKLLYPKFINI